MIKNSFILFPGIGKKTEMNLWKKGILNWSDLDKKYIRNKDINNFLKKAEEALDTKNGDFFSEFLPSNEHWRLYKEFGGEKTLFLDIETTGLSKYYDYITMIGTFNGSEVKIFVKDNNLSDFFDYIRNYDMIVTFNGKIFDIPFIEKEFPNIQIPPLHLDLRFLLKSIGINGPLKKIEKKLNIKRPKLIQEIGSRDAPILWNRFLRGYDDDLERLLLYNIYDVLNLQILMNLCYNKKIEEIELKMGHDQYQQKLFQVPEKSNKEYQLDIIPDFQMPAITKQYSQNGLFEFYLNDVFLLQINRKKIKKIDINISNLIKEIKMKNLLPISVGIDLSGSENKRNTGLCVLNGNQAFLSVMKSDDEIISKTININPTVISIDSPLSLPKGRDCVYDSCECRKYGILRECERILKRRGINVYPCLINSMQKMTMRGIKLAKIFEEKGYKVIESYPGAAQDIMGMPRKKIDLNELELNLKHLGIKVSSKEKRITHDELDALTSALVGYFYLAGFYEGIGNKDEGYLIIPDLNNDSIGE